MQNRSKILLSASLSAVASVALAQEKPNIVIILADDISAREFPIYDSSTWSKPEGGDTQDFSFRAQTPVMESLAEQGCMISTCWSATVSSPARAQLMTGRYAHLHKWWHNGDQGRFRNAEGKQETWCLYESSPLMIGKIAQEGGYATCWSGKTQMAHTDTNIDKYGFDEGCYTPGDLNKFSPHTDFTMTKIDNKTYIINDSRDTVSTYEQVSFYWQPSVMVVNTPHNTKPNTMEPLPLSEMGDYGLNTFGADVEQDFIFDFMERKHKEGTPFFAYHTAHLGHDAYDFINPKSTSPWGAVPKVEWMGDHYIRTEPNITGDEGVYDTHNSISPEGIHSHVNYLDYVIWRYMEKFEQMGIADNTILIVTADNGTLRYGKANPNGQRGVHVPLFIYAPCLEMTKSGKQDVLANLADLLPTVADIVGVELPKDYDINGESLIPFLTTEKREHRQWVYSYRSEMQFIRGDKVLRDGTGKWYDVSETPDDLGSFTLIKDWSRVSAEHRAQRDELESILPEFDLHETAHDGPGGIYQPKKK